MPYWSCLWLNRLSSAGCGTTSRRDLEWNAKVKDGSRSYAEVIADERAETPCQKLENETNRAMVRKIVDTLTRREQAVLYSRFGLNGHDPKNLEEVGKELNITDERVRQIQNAAFAKLRHRLKNFERGLICEEGGNGNNR